MKALEALQMLSQVWKARQNLDPCGPCRVHVAQKSLGRTRSFDRRGEQECRGFQSSRIWVPAFQLWKPSGERANADSRNLQV